MTADEVTITTDSHPQAILLLILSSEAADHIPQRSRSPQMR
jgi:hypothetical protein